ncbi:hypothetical protein PENSPDRAFT_650268, partial [Peniophora sp. CONT]
MDPYVKINADVRSTVSSNRTLADVLKAVSGVLLSAMKGIFNFNRLSKPPAATSPPPSAPVAPAKNTLVHPAHLQPKYTVPAVPHPRPHDHIAILVTPDALLLRPHLHRNQPHPYVSISYGKQYKVEERDDTGEGHGPEWDSAAVVYGIVGIIDLYTTSYLLVISSKADVGSVLDPAHAVYAVKNVAAIPLVYDRALKVLTAMSTKNVATSRPSLLPTPSSGDGFEGVQTAEPTSLATSEPRVKFVDEPEVKTMTPSATEQTFDLTTPDRPASPVSMASSLSSLTSGATTPVSSENGPSTTTLAKTLQDRLSFWQRPMIRRFSSGPETPTTTQPTMQSLAAAVEAGNQSTETLGDKDDELQALIETPAPAPVTEEEKNKELEEKILRQTVKDFARGEMYFAYDFDLTHSLQHKQDLLCRTQHQSHLLAELTGSNTGADAAASADVGDQVDVTAEPTPALPLWRRVDRQFWWNEHLLRPFTEAGLHPYVLPLMQGYVQVSTFAVPREPEVDMGEEGDAATVDYIIISRRSRERAGLRYQRRGIDDDARVANFVETEAITRIDREGITNVFSYVQLRGSIPLYWTQSGYSLKPPPQLEPAQTHAQNLSALKRHFERTVPAYGAVTIVNLAEQHGKEGQVTCAYRDYVAEADIPDVKYCEYDFHVETKGMKYENIQKLITDLERTFESQGYFWVSDRHILCRQNGVYRVNCIDCLDRTNVVQSAFARYVTNRQLLALALFNPESGRSDIDVVFNDVWANNGDAISRAYAGTSALKGDFTRTGKRDLGGMLNDGMNSLARMYASTFGDWFCQAVIDYILGYRTLAVFGEFLNKLASTDPRELIRLGRIRAEAVATSVARVLPEGEGLLSGWTLLSPAELNTKIGDKWEEKVLLVTRKALYIVSYDYNLEKVQMYTRVPLADIIEMQKGAYILSPLQEASRDPVQNAGFIVRWHTPASTTRVTSYSLRNSLDAPPPPLSPSIRDTFPSPPTTPKARMSFGSPPTSPSPLNPDASPKKETTTEASVSTPAPKPTLARALSRRSLGLGIGAPRLSNLLAGAAPAPDTKTTFAAFKALPVDPARSRRGSAFSEPADELAGAATCQDAVELMINAIRGACEDIGGGHSADGRADTFVKDADIVGLAEAQRMTTVYAKMEYGLKRLLWLGG